MSADVRLSLQQKSIMAIAANAWIEREGGALLCSPEQLHTARSLERRGLVTVSDPVGTRTCGFRDRHVTLTLTGRAQRRLP